ncbi:MAG: FecR domain-containing protein [Bacteroidia bacterium]|nr:FecR domain-containing protein [Bacteroidia bacterium]
MNFEKYKSYLAHDFAQDEAFVRWVASPESVDENFWKVFLQTYPDKRGEMDDAAEIIYKARKYFSEKTLNVAEKSAMHRQLFEFIHAEEEQILTNRTASFRYFFRWAAVFLLLIACGFTFFWYKSNHGYKKYETAFGETKTLSLPDGSFVRLNAHSRISFPVSWEEGADRCVWLEGEAFFEVKKQPEFETKFIVHASDLVVQVLGTKFNVNTRREKTRVVLNEGQIKLTLHNESSTPILMDPGDMVDYNHTQNQLVQTRVNPELHSSWKEGIQLFDKTPLAEILAKMEEIYGVSISLNDGALRERKMTMGIPVEDLNIALKTIESVLGLKIIRNGDNKFSIN